MAVKYVVDTSAFSAFGRQDMRLSKWFKHDHEIIMPVIVAGELRAGFMAGSKQKENERLLRRFLDSPNVSLAAVGDATSIKYADVYSGLRHAGKPIGTNDMWIAAICQEQAAPLLTLDGDFASVPGLQLVEL